MKTYNVKLATKRGQIDDVKISAHSHREAVSYGRVLARRAGSIFVSAHLVKIPNTVCFFNHK